MLAKGNAQKDGGKSTKIKTIHLSHNINGLAQNRKNTYPPTQWVRVE